MMSTSAKPFVWYELMTTDMDAAEAFYRAVVGWNAQNFSQPDMRYTMMRPARLGRLYWGRRCGRRNRRREESGWRGAPPA
jgi:predicted enzyme related to lactoylglutathione lyase